MRLEQENDDLAHELVTSKIALRNDLDQVNLSFAGWKPNHDDLLKGKGQVALTAVPLYWTLTWLDEWAGSGREGTAFGLNREGGRLKPLQMIWVISKQHV